MGAEEILARHKAAVNSGGDSGGRGVFASKTFGGRADRTW